MIGNLVGPEYFVKVEVRLVVHDVGLDSGTFVGRADVGQVTSREAAPAGQVALLDAPVQLELPQAEVERIRSLTIRDRRDRSVVTVIELLSPSHKSRGEDRDSYLVKRREILASQAHFVEIDLTRGGIRPAPPVLPPSTYYALVSRAEDRPRIGVWPIGLRELLPSIPIPLRSPDPPVRLDLKQVVDRAYDAAHYERFISQDEPVPVLPAADRAWAAAFLPTAGHHS